MELQEKKIVLSVYTILMTQKMIVFDTAKSIQEEILKLKSIGKKIGFIPTMGALHLGHVSLVNQAKKECDYVVVSIFVNPTQFNNPEDLKKYPRTLEKDCELLSQHDVDFIFAPNVEEIYPIDYTSPVIDLGNLDNVMEGKFRPGHFQGVVEVVKRLFEIILPNNAYFGKKDFQQVAVIKHMVSHFNMTTNIVECEIIRNKEGLALSSRNARLSEDEKTKASIIYKTLIFAKNNVGKYSPKELMKRCKNEIDSSDLRTEYLEIVDPKTLERLGGKWIPGATCCIAAYCGNVRLIDNMVLIDEI